MKKRLIAMALTAMMIASALGSQAAFASELTQETEVVTETSGTDETEIFETEAESELSREAETGETETSEIETEVVTEETQAIETEIDETELPAEETAEIEAQVSPEEANTRAFVERMYTVVLNRSSDKAGIDDWTEKLLSGQNDGADIAHGFFMSQEFIKKNYSNEDYINYLYAGLFDRIADDTGKETWLAALNNKLSRLYVLKGFIDSTEFKKLCESYGIEPGTISLTSVTDKNPKVTRFVTYLYRNILSREPEMQGLTNWVQQLVSKKKTAAEVALGFTCSDEFKNKNTSNEEYVKLLYSTILGRSADAAGLANWVKLLENGLSRNYVLNGFTQSTEFKNMCASYDIIAGKVTLTENRDKNAALTQYINNAYKQIYGRNATTSELNSWAGNIIGNKQTTTQMLKALVSSKSLSYNDSTVDMIYQMALGRGASSTEISNALSSYSSASALMDAVTESSEYRNKISAMGLTLKVEGWNTTSAGRFYVSNGTVLKGWQRINGNRYYFDTTTGYAYTGWHYLDGYKFYFESDGVLCQNVEDIIGPQSKYYLTVNCMTNLVTVYAKDGDNGYIIPVKAMVCTTGLDIYPTVKGTYTLSSHWRWGRMIGDVWAQYCTQISGDYLFHAVWDYYQDNKTMSITEYNRLGDSGSHGCVRLTVKDAKWIYDNCLGSTVYLSNYGIDAPFDQPDIPAPVVISGDMGYDPSDPNI